MANEPCWRWTQPVCQKCYVEIYSGKPSKMTGPIEEQCCYCGEQTQDGIYVRLDPYSVPHPTLLKEDD